MFDYNVFPSLSYFTCSHYIDLTRSTLLKEDQHEVVDEEKAELMWMVGEKGSQHWFKEADGLREGQLPLECSCQYDKALLIALKISSLARCLSLPCSAQIISTTLVTARRILSRGGCSMSSSSCSSSATLGRSTWGRECNYNILAGIEVDFPVASELVYDWLNTKLD